MSRRGLGSGATSERGGEDPPATAAPRRARATRAATVALVALPVLLTGATTVAAQESGGAARVVRAGLSPDTIGLGDMVELQIELEVPAGRRVYFPDSLDAAPGIETLRPVEWTAAPSAGGAVVVAVRYPLIAFQDGIVMIPDLEILTVPAGTGQAPGSAEDAVGSWSEVRNVTSAASLTRTAIPRQPLYVTSVLLLEGMSDGLVPRPADDVVGASWSWPLVLAAVAFMALLAWVVVAAVRDGVARGAAGRGDTHTPPIDPIEAARLAALAELDRLIGSGLHEKGAVDRFYDGTSDAVRGYVEHLDPAWGPAHTSTELMEALRRIAASEESGDLFREMYAAEVVKFGRSRPGAQDAVGHWRTLHDWVDERGPAAAQARPGTEAGTPGRGAPSAEGTAPARGGPSTGDAAPEHTDDPKRGHAVSFEFSAPLWLAFLLPLPVLWVWLRPRASEGFVVASAEADPSRSFGPGRAVALDSLPTLLRLASLGALILALAQPQLVRFFEEPVTEEVGIAFAIDLSTSMWAEDMARGTSRLEAAKTTVRQFLANRTDDIALVSFAGEALTRVPLTHDIYVVDAAVAELQVGLLIDGTDIAGAITAGAGLLKDTPHRSKVLILVTDGAHNKAGLLPALAARAAAAFDVTIYPIAIGRDEVTNAAGMETVLTQAARITGGQYFRATDVGALEAIYAELDQLMLPSEEVAERTEREPLAWWFLLASMGLLGSVTLLRGSRWGVLP